MFQKAAIEETVNDVSDNGVEKVDFETFCQIAAKFMTEEDEEGLRDELKEAFRIYDKALWITFDFGVAF